MRVLFGLVARVGRLDHAVVSPASLEESPGLVVGSAVVLPILSGVSGGEAGDPGSGALGAAGGDAPDP